MEARWNKQARDEDSDFGFRRGVSGDSVVEDCRVPEVVDGECMYVVVCTVEVWICDVM